jgi:hypothetical protein
MNTLNVFDLQIPVSIEKEINENLIRVDKNLEILSKDYKIIQSFETQLNTNMSIESIISSLKEYENCEKNERNYKNINDCIDLHSRCNTIEQFSNDVYVINLDESN